MPLDWLDRYSQWLVPVALVLAGFLLGVLVERITIPFPIRTLDIPPGIQVRPAED